MGTSARSARARAEGQTQRVDELVDAIRSYCSAHKDLSKLPKWQRYFKEGFDAWGLLDKDDPLWTVKRDAWMAAYADLGVDGFLKAGAQLFTSGKYEEGSLAIHFLSLLREQLTPADIAKLETWFAAGIANWAHTDVLCGMLLAPMLQSGQIPLSIFENWRTSQYRFQRRAVPVATLGLLKTKASTAALLEFLTPLMMDRERVVQQGMGWFLREAWKRERGPVEKFLTKWKDRAPRLIFQYATEKMTAEEKALYKRSRK